MITEHDLREAIAECEGTRNPTASTCMKLAAFYTLKDKMYPDPGQAIQEPVYYSRAAAPSDTDFSRLVSGMDYERVISIMDELMDTLQVVSPRIYAGVMRKLGENN